MEDSDDSDIWETQKDPDSSGDDFDQKQEEQRILSRIYSSAVSNMKNSPSTSRAVTCNHCKDKFPDTISLLKHLYDTLHPPKQHSLKQKIYKCTECDDFFTSNRAVNIHKAKKHPKIMRNLFSKSVIQNETIPAKIKKLSKEETISSFTKTQPKLETKGCLQKFMCLECDEIFPTEYSTRKHRTERHASAGLKSQLFVKINVPKTFCKTQKEQLLLDDLPRLTQTQLDKNRFQQKYMCLKCDKVFSGDDAVVKHTITYHPGVQLCDVFTKLFTKITISKDENKFQTQESKVSSQKGSIEVPARQEKIDINSPPKYLCLICFKAFPSKHMTTLHRAEMHPELKGCHLFSEITTKRKSLDMSLIHLQAKMKGTSGEQASGKIKIQENSKEDKVYKYIQKNDAKKIIEDNLTQTYEKDVCTLKRKLNETSSEYAKLRRLSQADLGPEKNKRSMKPDSSKDKVAKLYKCGRCCFYFTSIKSIKNHYKLCSSEHKIESANCPTCNFLFSRHELFSHIQSHHNHEKYRQFEVTELFSDTDKSETVPSKTICTICCIDFETTLDLQKHMLRSIHVPKILPNTSYLTTLKTAVDAENKSESERETFTELTDSEGETSLDSQQHEASQQTLNENMDESNNVLYKCNTCSLHFIEPSALETHMATKAHNTSKADCGVCGFSFSKISLMRHKLLHHQKLNMNREDFLIKTNFNFKCKEKADISKTVVDEAKTVSINNDNTIETHTKQCVVTKNLENTWDSKLYNNTLYECKTCSLHFISPMTFEIHMSISEHVRNTKVWCSICGLAFSKVTLALHKNVHHKQLKLTREDFVIKKTLQTECAHDEINPLNKDSEPLTNKSIEETVSSHKGNLLLNTNINEGSVLKVQKNKVKLYKCGDCNVHFIKEVSCLSHLRKHIKLDSKDYMKCPEPRCGLQFKYYSLRIHRKRHHVGNYDLKKVLIREYKPKKNKKSSFFTYYGKERVQSSQVSTSSEGSNLNDLLNDSVPEIAAKRAKLNTAKTCEDNSKSNENVNEEKRTNQGKVTDQLFQQIPADNNQTIEKLVMSRVIDESKEEPDLAHKTGTDQVNQQNNKLKIEELVTVKSGLKDQTKIKSSLGIDVMCQINENTAETLNEQSFDNISVQSEAEERLDETDENLSPEYLKENRIKELSMENTNYVSSIKKIHKNANKNAKIKILQNIIINKENTNDVLLKNKKGTNKTYSLNLNETTQSNTYLNKPLIIQSLTKSQRYESLDLQDLTKTDSIDDETNSETVEKIIAFLAMEETEAIKNKSNDINNEINKNNEHRSINKDVYGFETEQAEKSIGNKEDLSLSEKVRENTKFCEEDTARCNADDVADYPTDSDAEKKLDTAVKNYNLINQIERNITESDIAQANKKCLNIPSKIIDTTGTKGQQISKINADSFEIFAEIPQPENMILVYSDESNDQIYEGNDSNQCQMSTTEENIDNAEKQKTQLSRLKQDDFSVVDRTKTTEISELVDKSDKRQCNENLHTPIKEATEENPLNGDENAKKLDSVTAVDEIIYATSKLGEISDVNAQVCEQDNDLNANKTDSTVALTDIVYTVSKNYEIININTDVCKQHDDVGNESYVDGEFTNETGKKINTTNISANTTAMSIYYDAIDESCILADENTNENQNVENPGINETVYTPISINAKVNDVTNINLAEHCIINTENSSVTVSSKEVAGAIASTEVNTLQNVIIAEETQLTTNANVNTSYAGEKSDETPNQALEVAQEENIFAEITDEDNNRNNNIEKVIQKTTGNYDRLVQSVDLENLTEDMSAQRKVINEITNEHTIAETSDNCNSSYNTCKQYAFENVTNIQNQVSKILTVVKKEVDTKNTVSEPSLESKRTPVTENVNPTVVNEESDDDVEIIETENKDTVIITIEDDNVSEEEKDKEVEIRTVKPRRKSLSECIEELTRELKTKKPSTSKEHLTVRKHKTIHRPVINVVDLELDRRVKQEKVVFDRHGAQITERIINLDSDDEGTIPNIKKEKHASDKDLIESDEVITIESDEEDDVELVSYEK